MTYLDIRTAITVVERAVVDALSLAFQTRSQVADLAALKAIPSMIGRDNMVAPDLLRFVRAEGVCYRWRAYSTMVESLPYVVQPADRSINSRGRWERQTSTVTFGPAYFRPVHRQASGYALAVQLWRGDEGTEAARARIFAQSPAFLVRWVGDVLKMKGNHPRAVNQVDMPFEIWCFAHNNRDERQSLEGSDMPQDQGEPGLHRMIGDVRYLLAGCDLGLSPGVRYVDVQGTAEIIEEDLAERQFVGVVPILVKASVNIPDEDLVSLDEIWVQFQQMGGADPQIDGANYLRSGYRVAAGSGLSGTPTPGVAYVQGQVVSSQPGAHLFAASSDTYRFLAKDGSLTYVRLPNGYDPPWRSEPAAQPAGTLLLGVTTTNSSDITFDALLCDYITDSGEPFRCPV